MFLFDPRFQGEISDARHIFVVTEASRNVEKQLLSSGVLKYQHKSSPAIRFYSFSAGPHLREGRQQWIASVKQQTLFLSVILVFFALEYVLHG